VDHSHRIGYRHRRRHPRRIIAAAFDPQSLELTTMPDERRHPTNADREAAARPTVAALLRALEMRDPAGLAALLRDDAAWLSAEGTDAGAAARTRARAFFADDQGRRWADAQQHGAHAVLRWADTDTGAVGALMVEIRGAAVVLVCEAP